MEYCIDTHVHVYHCYEAEILFSQASKNCDAPDSAEGLILCLTESSGFNFYQQLKDRVKNNETLAGWLPTALKDEPAILLSKGKQNIIIVAGRQVISKQGLEVLALFNDQTYDDGQNTQIIIDQIVKNKGIAVLPWGVGKWLGTRGKIIEQLLHDNQPGNLAIADISARPALWPQPVQFDKARKSGYNCLYGTDPLPLDYEQHRVASAGMVMELPSEASEAVARLKNLLLHQTENNFYGKRVSVLRFIKDQLMLRLNKQACLSAR